MSCVTPDICPLNAYDYWQESLCLAEPHVFKSAKMHFTFEAEDFHEYMHHKNLISEYLISKEAKYRMFI
jgi:hypothetical protein